MDDITIYCILDGEPIFRAFPITIGKNSSIGLLKKHIKTECSKQLGDVEANDLDIYSVSILKDEDRGKPGVLLFPAAVIGNIYPNPPQGYVHFLVKWDVNIPVSSKFGGGTEKTYNMLEECNKLLDICRSRPRDELFRTDTILIPSLSNFYDVPPNIPLPKAEEATLQTNVPTTEPYEYKFLDVSPAQLPCRKSTILVRDEYRVVEKLLYQSIFNLSNNTVDWGDAAIQGTPGIGKTVFLSYLLVLRIIKRLPTIYRLSELDWYLFPAEGKCKEITVYDIDLISDVLVLTDAVISTQGHSLWRASRNWKFVFAASPHTLKQSKVWEKEALDCSICMGGWDWTELVAAFQLTIGIGKQPTLQEYQRLYSVFTCLGSNPRLCINFLNPQSMNYLRKLKSTYRKLLTEVEKYVYNMTIPRSTVYDIMTNFENPSTVVTLWVDKNDELRVEFHYQLSTKYIAGLVFQSAAKYRSNYLYIWFEAFLNEPKMRGSAGWVFESYVHDIFSKGGDFKAVHLCDDGPIHDTLEFTILPSPSTTGNLNDDSRYFRNFKELEQTIRQENSPKIKSFHIGKYMQPIVSNNVSFDSLLFTASDTVVLFQITIGETHEINHQGLNSLYIHLPASIDKVKFVWVVPEESRSNYLRAKAITKLGEDNSGDNSGDDSVELERDRKRKKVVSIRSSKKEGMEFRQYRLEISKAQLRGGEAEACTQDILSNIVDKTFLLLEDEFRQKERIRANTKAKMIDMLDSSKDPVLAALRRIKF